MHDVDGHVVLHVVLPGRDAADCPASTSRACRCCNLITASMPAPPESSLVVFVRFSPAGCGVVQVSLAALRSPLQGRQPACTPGGGTAHPPGAVAPTERTRDSQLSQPASVLLAQSVANPLSSQPAASSAMF